MDEDDEWEGEGYRPPPDPSMPRCGPPGCGFHLCREVPWIDCSGFRDPPVPDNEWRMEYPIEHGPKCKGHKRYLFRGQVWLRDGRLMPPASPGTIRPLDIYL